jgi:hypothetical protein
MKIKGSSYLFIAIMIFMLVIIGFSLRMEYLESRLLPLVISSVVFVLAAIGLVRKIMVDVKAEVTVTEGETTIREKPGESWRSYLLAGAWLAGFMLTIYLLGFIVAIPLFILAYMKSHGTRWLVAITFAILTTLLIYGLFELALGVILYRGLVPSWWAT